MYQFAKAVVACEPEPLSVPTRTALEIADLLDVDVKVCGATDADDPAIAVLEACDELVGEGWTADLILVGTRPAARGARSRIGTTAARLLRNSPVPVWCVRPGRIGIETTVAVAVDPAADNAELLVDLGVEIAAMLSAGLLLVHADTETDRVDEASKASGHGRSAEQQLQVLLGKTDSGRVAYGVRPFVKTGRADRVVLEAVDSFDVDLLIVGGGAHPLGGLSNVCEGLMTELDCSLLMIPKGWQP